MEYYKKQQNKQLTTKNTQLSKIEHIYKIYKSMRTASVQN